MKKLVVVRVSPFAHGSESAEVTLSSGQGEVVAFCYPCTYRVGDQVPNLLYALDGEAKASFLSDWPEEEKARLSIERIERTTGFGYRGCGRPVDVVEGRITVNGFVIEMGELPWESPVDFEIGRLDLR